MNGARKRTVGLVLLGLAAFGLRLWAVLSLPEGPAWAAVAQLLQCLVGMAVAVAVAFLGWTLVPDRVYFGWVAGWTAALYPPHVEMVARPHVAPWAALVLTLLLLVVVRPQWRGPRWHAAVAGALAGLLFVLEPLLALAVPACVAAFCLAEKRARYRGAAPRLAGQSAAVPVGRVSNSPPTSWKLVLHWLRKHAGNLPDELANVALLLGVAMLVAAPSLVRNRIAYGRLLLQDYTAVSTADALPRSYGELCLRRAQSLFLGSDRTPHAPREAVHHAERDEYVPDAAFLNRAGRVAVVAWLVLILIGLSVSWDRWRRLWPTYAVFAAVAAGHILLGGPPWVRTALEPMTLVWASLAVAPLLVRLAPQRKIKIHRPGQQGIDPFGAEHVIKGPHYEIPERRRAG